MINVLAHRRFAKLSALEVRRGLMGVSGISTVAEAGFTACSLLDAMAFEFRLAAAKFFSERASSHDYLE